MKRTKKSSKTTQRNVDGNEGDDERTRTSGSAHRRPPITGPKSGKSTQNASRAKSSSNRARANGSSSSSSTSSSNNHINYSDASHERAVEERKFSNLRDGMAPTQRTTYFELYDSEERAEYSLPPARIGERSTSSSGRIPNTSSNPRRRHRRPVSSIARTASTASISSVTSIGPISERTLSESSISGFPSSSGHSSGYTSSSSARYTSNSRGFTSSNASSSRTRQSISSSSLSSSSNNQSNITSSSETTESSAPPNLYGLPRVNQSRRNGKSSRKGGKGDSSSLGGVFKFSE